MFLKRVISGCAESLLLCQLFSSCGQGLLFVAGRGTHCGGFSCCGACRLSSCGFRAYLLCGMLDPPRSRFQPESSALAGRFFTTEPTGKPEICLCSQVSGDVDAGGPRTKLLESLLFLSFFFFFLVRKRKEVKVIDTEEVRIMTGLGHQSSIKAQCAHGVLGEHILQVRGYKGTLRREGRELQRRRALWVMAAGQHPVR